MQHTLTFTGENIHATVTVPTNTLLADAALQAGIDIGQPCGGQGRCGRCAVQVTEGQVRRRSALRLSPSDVEAGYALACQAVVEGDAVIFVPPQEKIERRLT
ncbi:MAG: 2Fe-2S iron-sulfur cluster binding domain-containing protein, partial [Anaerolineales bacterium]|nr:2Fe-2S iron-sulfur cluster binding domain-containing protein [Anaerolineales bacterium]